MFKFLFLYIYKKFSLSILQSNLVVVNNTAIDVVLYIIYIHIFTFSPSLMPHHFDKLQVIDNSISILIRVLNYFLHFCFCELLSQRCHHFFKLGRADLPISILIKHSELCNYLILANTCGLLNHQINKLLKLNKPTMVFIILRNLCFDFLVIRILAQLLQNQFKLLKAYSAVSILIKNLKCFFIIFKLVLTNPFT